MSRNDPRIPGHIRRREVPCPLACGSVLAHSRGVNFHLKRKHGVESWRVRSVVERPAEVAA